MGGGLMQLVAYGAQDVYLTGNPQITFWKVVYRRHTNFAMESIEQTFNGTADFGKKVTCTISRNGDLVHKVYLQVTLPKLKAAALATTGNSTVRWADHIGHRLIKSVEVEIGGQQIDKHYGEWLNVLHELSCPSEKLAGEQTMLGYSNTEFTNVADGSVDQTSDNVTHITQTTDATTLYIPLQFWFCRNPGLAVPLIALQYHEVKINLEFNALVNNMVLVDDDKTAATAVWEAGTTADNLDSTSLASAALWVDYIYLDTDERRRFAQVSHEYLIEQLQFTGTETLNASSTNKVRMNFNHPVKELVWVADGPEHVAADSNANPPVVEITGAPLTWQSLTGNVKMLLNGHDRFAERDSSYFNLVQPYQHHTRVPSGKNVHCYSFALKPEEHQPSGTCNFSRIDNATLQIGTAANEARSLRLFAVNYNVLRVMSGMGGLAYSN